MSAIVLAAAGTAANTGAITAVHLVLIAVLAAAAVATIVWGMIAKRRRAAAEELAHDRQDEMAAAPPTDARTEPPAETQRQSQSQVQSAPAPVTAAPSTPLTTIKGLGPKAAAMLEDRGINDVAALAAVSDADAGSLDADLGAFSGRLSRDRWVEQARLLAAGDTAAFEAQFGKLG